MSVKGVNKDYWALRDWGVSALTALKMLGMAYCGEEVENEKEETT